MVKFDYYFGVTDYIIFVLFLVLSALTGIYFALRHKIFKVKKENVTDYLTGKRNLKPFPVAVSLIASYVSGVTMLGNPAEVYRYGAALWMTIFAIALSSLCVAYVYLPVFSKLRVASSYEYLELRFSSKLRTVASFLFLFDEIMFLPMLIYVPSLAFGQVSGANIHLIGIISCAVCVFYTIVGGVRAVVYTDLWQTILMFVADIVVIIAGIVAVGGIGFSVEKGIEGGRLPSPNFSPSLYERFTIWGVIFGGFFYWTAFNSVNQTMVQRYLSLQNDTKARLAIAIFTVGMMFFTSCCCYAGVLMYARYYDCDPFTAKRVEKPDQLLPLFTLEVAGDIIGIPGLFIAGVFGAGLSSLSVVLNSCAIVLLEDICTGLCGISLTEKKTMIVSKIIVIIFGVITCLMVLVVENLGGVFPVAYALSSIVAGTMWGVYSLGMLIPWSNEIGAIAGAAAGCIFSCILSYGNLIVSGWGYLTDPKLITSVENCQKYGLNISEPEPVYIDDSKVFPLFRLAYLWITPAAFVMVMIVGTLASFCAGKTDLKTLDPDIISPVVHWLLPPEAQNYAGVSVKNIENKRLLERLDRASPSAPDETTGTSSVPEK